MVASINFFTDIINNVSLHLCPNIEPSIVRLDEFYFLAKILEVIGNNSHNRRKFKPLVPEFTISNAAVSVAAIKLIFRAAAIATHINSYTQSQNMPELDINLPSTRQTQGLIKDKIEVSIKLLTGDVFAGRIVWQDVDCIFFADSNDLKTLIYRHAIAYIQPK